MNTFSQQELDLYEMFLDQPGELWAVQDLLRGDGFDNVVFGVRTDLHKEMFLKMIVYINEELRDNNDHIIPSELLRKNRYPLIRQMRDVHQFDVGSHLAYCYALTIRNAPVLFCKKQGLGNLASTLDGAMNSSTIEQLAIASVLHDIFKCFRSRRKLPEKEGRSLQCLYHMPDGTIPDYEGAYTDENSIASHITPFFYGADVDQGELFGMIKFSGQFGAMLYRLIKQDSLTAFEKFIQGVDSSKKAHLGGIYLAIIDWLGKGHARHLITTRKSCKFSVQDAGLVVLGELDKNLK